LGRCCTVAHNNKAQQSNSIDQIEGLLILGKAVPEDVADVTLALREMEEILIRGFSNLLIKTFHAIFAEAPGEIVVVMVTGKVLPPAVI